MQKKPKGWLKSSWDTTQAVNARLTSRGERWNALYDAGGGTVSEYVHADFNTDCPNGLDTEPWADQSVRLESLFKSENYKNSGYFGKISNLRWGGWVQWDKDDIINLNPLWYSPLSLKFRTPLRVLVGKKPRTMADIIPHEFIHTRQHHSDHSGWMRNNTDNDIDYVGMFELSKPRRMWRKIARFYYDNVTLDRRFGTTSEYYGRNVEIQARMHEILAYGYAQWERLPINKVELWAALANLGLEAPASVLEELNSTEEGRQALEDFKVLSGIKSTVSNIVKTFNRIHDYVGETEVQEAIWQAKYPLLYGELIEFYGDKLGRERLDMGTNPRSVIEAMHELKKHDGELIQADAQRLAERIPPSLAAAFLNSIIIEYPEGSDHFDNAMLLSKALLAREDVRGVMFADEQILRNYTGQYEDPPLNMALLRGHIPMTRLLMNAGADPFQRYTLIDMREKPLFSSCPVSCAYGVLSDEKHLADPSNLPRRSRKFFKDPASRERIIQSVNERRAALEEMMRCSDDPDLDRKLYNYEGNYEEVSLNQMLAKIGITKNRTGQDPDMSIEMH